jgi:tetratricopeptide (TPR) repeat protein
MNLQRTFLQVGVSCLAFLLPVSDLRVDGADGSNDDYQRGMKLAEEAWREGRWQQRDELLADAQHALFAFVGEHPQSQAIQSALQQLGNVVVERARMHKELYDEAGNENYRIEARALYHEAYGVFARLKVGSQRELKELAVTPGNAAETIERRDQLLANNVQAVLYMAVCLEKVANTYDPGSAEQRQTLSEAAEEYRQIYEDHRVRLAGLYARLGQCRCLRQQGQCEQALECMAEILELPDTVVHFRPLKTKTLSLAMDCLADDSQKDYRQAIRLGDEWLEKHGEKDPQSADWLEFRYHLARTHLLLANTIDRPDLRKAHLDEVRTLAEYVAGRQGEFQTKARELMTDASTPQPTETSPAPNRPGARPRN